MPFLPQIFPLDCLGNAKDEVPQWHKEKSQKNRLWENFAQAQLPKSPSAAEK